MKNDLLFSTCYYKIKFKRVKNVRIYLFFILVVRPRLFYLQVIYIKLLYLNEKRYSLQQIFYF